MADILATIMAPWQDEAFSFMSTFLEAPDGQAGAFSLPGELVELNQRASPILHGIPTVALRSTN